jgi:two-component system nitrogen regulation response regulator NtrX
LLDEGWQATVAHSGKDGIKKFMRENPDLVLLDIWMTGMDGIETLQKLKELRRDVPVVIMSGHGSIETAVKATKLGAFEYLEKPLSLDKLLPMLEHAGEIRGKRDKQEQGISQKHDLIGTSPNTENVRKQIRLVAPKNAWVLITGENGTGKEVVAQQIHMSSPRAKHPFVAINCAAIPEELIESELFGHEKGSFTNAMNRKKGKFEIAHKGTLFLDEIGDMSIKTQAKILRILQEQQFERVGGRESITVDVRVIAATNKDLEKEIKAGNFREDLFYRLNVIPFVLAPLRERGEDVLLLAKRFLQQNSTDLGESAKFFSAEAEAALVNYSWPGNVRELKNMIERLCIMVQGDEIKLTDLPEVVVSSAPRLQTYEVGGESASLKQARSDFERSFILKKLEECDWNVSKTAEIIGIERSNLHRKLRAYDIDPKQLKG